MDGMSHAAVNELLNLVYAAAYKEGHHDTVEGQFTDVLPCDIGAYHQEAVDEVLAALIEVPDA